jgi:hypothetical protein
LPPDKADKIRVCMQTWSRWADMNVAEHARYVSR